MRTFAGLVLRGLGWRYHMPPAPSKKYVLIGAPHTSNWDFFVGILALWALGIRARWLGKKELFRPPLGWLLRLLGGIPVDRSRRNNLVDQVVEIFRQREEIAILITPEGTRGKAPYWRTGFYHMALKAGVPIALGFVDFRRKEVGIGGYLWPTGDIRQDFAEVRAFYQDKVGLRPERQGPIRIREEVEEAEDPRPQVASLQENERA